MIEISVSDLRNFLFYIILSSVFIFSQNNTITVEEPQLYGFEDVVWTSDSAGPYYLYLWSEKSNLENSYEYLTTLTKNSIYKLSDLDSEIKDKISGSLKPNKRYWFTINSNYGLDIEIIDSISTFSAIPKDIVVEISDSSASLELIDEINPDYTNYLITLIDQGGKPHYVGTDGHLVNKKYWFQFNKEKKIEITRLIPDSEYTLEIKTRNLDGKTSEPLRKPFRTELYAPDPPSFLQIVRDNENFVAKWKSEYSHTDTLIFSSEKEAVIKKLAMDKKTMEHKFTLNKNSIDPKSINKYFLKKTNRAGSSN